jgi:hypothetical protein
MKSVCKFLWMSALVIALGFAISACKEPKAELPPLTGTVSISGTAQVGETLTAVTTALDGNGTISYEWKRWSTTIGTDATYIIADEDEGY